MIFYANGEDLSGMFTSLTFSGSDTDVARKLDFSLVSSPTDSAVPVVELAQGAEIVLHDDEDQEVFYGSLRTMERSISGNTTNYTAYDQLFTVLKSDVSLIVEGESVSSATGKILEQLGLDYGGAPTEGELVDRIFDGTNAYDSIMTLWTLQSQKDEKLYMPVVKDRKICIIEKGRQVSKYVYDPGTAIVDASYKESSEDVVSSIKIYDEDNEEVGELKQEASIPVGAQKIYKHNSESTDAEEEAKKIFKDLEQSASVELLGDLRCRAGQSIVIKEPYTGLFGRFHIRTDTHEFSNHNYKTSLELAFVDSMDEKDVGGLEGEEASEDFVGDFSDGSAPVGGANGRMISYAKTRMGDRYVYGSSARSGTSDCSGLVWNAMKAAGYKGGRFSTREMHAMARKGILKKIPLSQKKPGDILWMDGHTGLYYGNGKTLEATPPKVGIYGFNYQRWTTAFRYVGGK